MATENHFPFWLSAILALLKMIDLPGSVILIYLALEYIQDREGFLDMPDFDFVAALVGSVSGRVVAFLLLYSCVLYLIRNRRFALIKTRALYFLVICLAASALFQRFAWQANRNFFVLLDSLYIVLFCSVVIEAMLVRNRGFGRNPK